MNGVANDPDFHTFFENFLVIVVDLQKNKRWPATFFGSLNANQSRHLVIATAV